MITIVASALVAIAAWWAVPSWRADRTAHVVAAGTRERSALLARARERARLGFGPASRRRAARERARTVQALGSLAAELESGQPPTSALLAAGGDPSIWPATAAAIPLGEDIAAGLANDARVRPALRHLGACWEVSTSTGTGFAAAVTRLADSERAAERVRVNLEGELAGPRATARMLALLPIIGIGFGMMLGSDPLSWLLTTVPGLACLVVGVTLTILGTVWTGRIAASVERLL